MKVAVVDIWKGGVRFRVPQPIAAGEQVELELAPACFAAVDVRWSQGIEAHGTFVNMR